MKVQGSIRRRLLGAVLTLFTSTLLVSAPASAAYPEQPIKLVVPFPPGGANDIVARLIAPPLSQALGQSIVIENKAGASGTIGTAGVARAAPDGYTLVMAAVPLVITPSLMPDLSYKIDKDFQPISLLSKTPFLLAVNPKLPVNNVQDLIALAKKDPGTITYSSPGTGSPAHLAAGLIAQLSGAQMTHVPYKGGAPAIVDVVAGHVSFTLATPAELLSFAKQGQLRIIGATTAQRISFLPDIPTLQEQGLKGYDLSVWYGVLGPAGMPADVVAKLNQNIQKLLQPGPLAEQLKAQGMEASAGSSEAFGAFLQSERKKWDDLAKQAVS